MQASTRPGELRFRDLTPDDPRVVEDLLPILRQLRPGLEAKALERIYDEGWPQGLRFCGAYRGSHCVGAAGWRIVANLSRGRQLYVDDLAVDEADRSRGVGAALLDAIEERACAAGCTAIALESGVQRTEAHRFYFRQRMAVTSFHFTKWLAGSKGPI
ncbi:GNAT family N-acetyltransferase [Humibacter antri]